MLPVFNNLSEAKHSCNRLKDIHCIFFEEYKN